MRADSGFASPTTSTARPMHVDILVHDFAQHAAQLRLACERVERSHILFRARSRNSRRMILPVAVIGRASTNLIARGVS